MLQKKYLLRLMKEKFEPAQCTTGGGLGEKKRLQYITGVIIFNILQLGMVFVLKTNMGQRHHRSVIQFLCKGVGSTNEVRLYSFREEGISTKEK